MSERATWRIGKPYSFPVLLFDRTGKAPKGTLVSGQASAFQAAASFESNGSPAAAGVTVTVAEDPNVPGLYWVSFTPTAFGHYVVRVWHELYNSEGWVDEIETSARASGLPAYCVTGTVTDPAPAPTAFLTDLNTTYNLTGVNFGGWVMVWLTGANAYLGPSTGTGVGFSQVVDLNYGADQGPDLSGFITTEEAPPSGSVATGDTFMLIPNTSAKFTDTGFGPVVSPDISGVAAAVWGASRTFDWGIGTLGRALTALVFHDGSVGGNCTSSTIVLSSSASTTDGFYNGCLIQILGFEQAPRVITGYVGSTKTATISPNWNQIPNFGGFTGSSKYALLSAGPVGRITPGIISASSFAANALAAVWDEVTSAHVTAGTFGKLLGAIALSAAGNVKSDLEEWRASVPNALVSSNVPANVSAVTAGAIAAASFAANALGAVWDELLASHVVVNSFGKILGTNVDAATSSRATPAQILATPANLLATDASGRVTVGSIGASAIDAAQITAGAAQFIADQLLDRANAVETGFTVRKTLRAIISATAAKVSGMNTGSPVFRSADDSADRIAATVDADGNRTAVTFTL